MDLTRYTRSAHGHPETATGGALSRVIMVRKTEQRVFTSLQNQVSLQRLFLHRYVFLADPWRLAGADITDPWVLCWQVPKVETLTKETVETFRGNRTHRKVTTCQKKDLVGDLASGLHSALTSGYATPRTPGTPYTGSTTGTATPLTSASGLPGEPGRGLTL